MFGLNKKPQEEKTQEDQVGLTQDQLDSLEFSEDSTEISLGNVEEEEVIKEDSNTPTELEEPEQLIEPVHPVIDYFADWESKMYEVESRINQVEISVKQILEYLNKQGDKDK